MTSGVTGTGRGVASALGDGVPCVEFGDVRAVAEENASDGTAAEGTAGEGTAAADAVFRGAESEAAGCGSAAEEWLTGSAVAGRLAAVRGVLRAGVVTPVGAGAVAAVARTAESGAAVVATGALS